MGSALGGEAALDEVGHVVEDEGAFAEVGMAEEAVGDGRGVDGVDGGDDGEAGHGLAGAGAVVDLVGEPEGFILGGGVEGDVGGEGLDEGDLLEEEGLGDVGGGEDDLAKVGWGGAAGEEFEGVEEGSVAYGEAWEGLPGGDLRGEDGGRSAVGQTTWAGCSPGKSWMRRAEREWMKSALTTETPGQRWVVRGSSRWSLRVWGSRPSLAWRVAMAKMALLRRLGFMTSLA